MTEAEIIDGILQIEKGYADRAADRGGPTNFGITISTLSSWRRMNCTADDVKNMQPSEARAIYGARYLKPWAWLTDERLRVLCVDWAVTSWHDNPIKALQAAVGTLADGDVGPETKRMTAGALARDAGYVYRSVLAARRRYYTDLAMDELPVQILLKSNKTLNLHNLRGWLNRCEMFA